MAVDTAAIFRALPDQNLARYRALLSSSLYPITLDLGGSEQSFRARFNERNVGALRFVKAHANAGFECRGHANARSGDGHYLLQLQETGGTAYVHRGLNAVCGTDSLILMQPRKTIVGAQFGAADALVVKIPERLLMGIAPRAEEFCSTPVDTTAGSANILARMIKDVWTWHESLTEYDHRVLPESMLRLVNAVFSNSTSEASQRQRHRNRQLERLREIIAANLFDPTLSVDALCHLLDASRTSVFALTRMAGTTVERMIIGARLEAAERRLRDAEFHHLSVAEIAFSSGFQDLSHFSRRFKQRYRLSPAQYRLQHADSCQ